MPWILILLLLILTVSIIVIAASKKKEEPKKICSDYTYKNECVSSCGDKFVDEEKRICYDSIPEGKFAFEKKIVSSCNDKYKYGKTCVISCGDKYIDETSKTCYDSNSIPAGKFLDGNKIVSSCGEKYKYGKTCVISCGDKYIDETSKTCYDSNSIPAGKFLDGNKIVSSCGEKYNDGQLCVSDCISRPENKIIQGKSCIKDCEYYLPLDTKNIGLVKECKENCDNYYINDIFNRVFSHKKYCILPQSVPSINMNNLFIFGNKNYMFDLEDGDNEKIFLRKKMEEYNIPNKEFNPVVFSGIENSFLRKIDVSPDGTTYAVMYNDHVDVYKQDIFNNETFTALRVNSPLQNVTFERCFVYDQNNLLIFLKQTNNENIVYKIYHVLIKNFEENLVQYFMLNVDIIKQLKDEARLYSAIEVLKTGDINYYNIGYAETVTDGSITTKYVYFINYYVDPNIFTAVIQNLNNGQPPSIQTFNNNVDILDVKITKDFASIFVNDKSNQPSQLEMIFVSLYGTPNSNKDTDNTINSYPIAISKNNKSYYTKYNTTDKTISVYEASYDEAKENNISSFSNIYTFTGNYESNVNVTIACNLEGTYLLCAIEEINAQNEVDKKELRQVDLTLVPKMDTLIMSS